MTNEKSKKTSKKSNMGSIDSSQIVLTGDRPTGKLHLGNYAGSLRERVELQDKYTQYVMVADMQALTDNFEHPEKVRNNVLEVMLDNLAVGVDPAKTIFFIQSQVPEIAELAMYFLNLVTLARLKRNPTVKDEMKQKGYGENVPAGFLMYPVSQAADILFCKATLVPVGADQLPMIEQTNEIVEKFNRIYGKTFSKVHAIVPEFGRLPGIDGKAKMSKSLNNAIFLSDSRKEIEKKVMQMYTDPGHIHAADPGKIEGNVVFAYLDAFDGQGQITTPNPLLDKEGVKASPPFQGGDGRGGNFSVAELKEQYQKGGLGDVEIKRRLIDVLDNLISPIREKREYLAKDPKAIMQILEEGTKKVRIIAQETLKEVRRAMKIDYF